MRRDVWDAALNQAAELAELPVTTHDLRHTYAARMIDGGLDIYTLARQLGDSLAVTERIYAQLVPGGSPAGRRSPGQAPRGKK